MYVFFYSKYSSKSIELMNRIDAESKKLIKFISIDDSKVREYVSKYITEVPCMVIKEGSKTYICDYNTLRETFKGDEVKLSFSNGESSSGTGVSQKKLDMNRVLNDMKEHENAVNQQNNRLTGGKKADLSNIEKQSGSMFSQYTTNIIEPIANENTASVSTENITSEPIAPITGDISNFFKFRVSDKRDAVEE